MNCVRITLHPHAPISIGSTFGSTSTSHFLSRNFYASCIRTTPSRSRTNLHWINIRIHIHLPLPIQESLRSLHTDAASPRLRPIIASLFYRSFRKAYASSNWMYLFLPIDRFLRTRSRISSQASLMYLNPVVSLSVSSFELLVLVLSIYTILCSVPVVPILSHVLTSRSHIFKARLRHRRILNHVQPFASSSSLSKRRLVTTSLYRCYCGLLHAPSLHHSRLSHLV